jgi:nucleoside-diphosphate-sugar epimerase
MTKNFIKPQVLVTGSTGFIGRALLVRLGAENLHITATVRNNIKNAFDKNVKVIHVGELTSSLDWRRALEGVNVVIHLASRVHIMSDRARDSSDEYRRINVNATINLAHQAAEVGVRRFIYLSSIKVNGEFTEPGEVFTAEDTPLPQDPYGVSKLHAELGLRAIASKTGMEVVIIRPPLVYGPGVKANFLRMMRWLSRPIPLPLGAINNLRSFVALDNLVDLIVRCIDHPGAANQIFLVSDGEDISTTSLLYRMGNALGNPARLIPVPTSWLHFFGTLLGRQAIVGRLCLSLQVDILKTRKLLDWSPPINMDEGLRRVTRDFKIK